MSAAERLPISDVNFVDRPESVARALSPLRRQILGALEDPDSASGIARKLGLARQKVNYHLRALEKDGFVELAEERQRRGCVERVLRVTARRIVVDPTLLPGSDKEEPETGDRASSAWLLAATTGVLRDVATLRQRAQSVGKPLTTATFQGDVAFKSAADLKAYTEELAGALAALAAKYHAPDAENARSFRWTTTGHPVITKSEAEAAREAAEHAARKEE